MVTRVLVDDREVRVTNPDRVLVDGVTKAAALEYFLAVGDGILGALRDRPVMLERRRDDTVFFQRRLPQGAPEWVATVRGPEYDLVCPDDLATIAWMVNLGAVTFHPWPVRARRHGHARPAADRPRPAGGNRLRGGRRGRPRWCARCCTSAGSKASRRRPAGAGCTSSCRSRAATLGRGAGAARGGSGTRSSRASPSSPRCAGSSAIAARACIVDCGPQTVASAYSIRPGGLVSAPLGWDELDAVAPEDFDVTSMPERFAAIGDLAP